MPNLLDGRAIAYETKEKLSTSLQKLQQMTGLVPGLAVIRVGEDPASQLYVQTKGRQALELGLHFEEHAFPSSAQFDEVKRKILELNQAHHIHGIVLQLPLPVHLDKEKLISTLAPEKDVDGIHPLNAGKLFQGIPGGFLACTPMGCLTLIKTIHQDLKGLVAGVVGTSLLVGRPLALLMLQQKCTVWMAHSETRNLPDLCRSADILTVAIGRPKTIQGEWIKKGATVIDVGINRLSTGELVGDVDYDAAKKVAGAITPVPGGVGPMTVVSLLQNTIESAYRHANQEFLL